MTCTIIIYDYNTLPFLKGCMRQIAKYKHPDIEQTILISEQGSPETFNAARKLFGDCVHHLPPLGSGYAIDYFIRSGLIKSEWLCTIDVDTMPISRNWLYVPIKLCEEYKFAFAGVQAEIDEAYGGGFFCMCQYWRVGRAKDFEQLSRGGGFTKWDRRPRSGMEFNDGNWTRGWSDDAVIAHWWEDRNLLNDKFTFATLQYLDVAPSEGRYGRNTDDLVFHFAFSYNSTQVGKPIEALGRAYWDWMYHINHTDFSEELLNRMLSELRPLEVSIQRRVWTNKTIIKPSDELNNYINKLKCEF